MAVYHIYRTTMDWAARCLFRVGLFDLLENIVLRDPWQLPLLATMDVRINEL